MTTPRTEAGRRASIEALARAFADTVEMVADGVIPSDVGVEFVAVMEARLAGLGYRIEQEAARPLPDGAPRTEATRAALNLARSIAISGEPWSEDAGRAYLAALDELDTVEQEAARSLPTEEGMPAVVRWHAEHVRLGEVNEGCPLCEAARPLSQRNGAPRTEAGRRLVNDFLNGPGGFGYAGITADDLRNGILAIEQEAARPLPVKSESWLARGDYPGARPLPDRCPCPDHVGPEDAHPLPARPNPDACCYRNAFEDDAHSRTCPNYLGALPDRPEHNHGSFGCDEHCPAFDWPDRPEPSPDHDSRNVERLAEAMEAEFVGDIDPGPGFGERWWPDRARSVLARLSQPPDPATAHEVNEDG